MTVHRPMEITIARPTFRWGSVISAPLLVIVVKPLNARIASATDATNPPAPASLLPASKEMPPAHSAAIPKSAIPTPEDASDDEKARIRALNKLVDDEWAQWTKECDTGGGCTYYAMQALIMGGVFERSVMEGVVQITSVIEEKIKKLPKAEQEKALSDMAASLQSGMPPRENPRINISVDSVHGSGPLAHVHCVIHGNCNYKQTGLLQAYTAHHLLQAPPKRYGFASGCQAFGHRELLGVLQSFGLVSAPGVTRAAPSAGAR